MITVSVNGGLMVSVDLSLVRSMWNGPALTWPCSTVDEVESTVSCVAHV